jgi:CheY-like chemotaxis protein
MPRMSGSELCRQLRDRRPETRILVMSGYLGDQPQPAAAFLQKPFSAPDLVRMVEQVLASALKPGIPAASRNS